MKKKFKRKQLLYYYYHHQLLFLAQLIKLMLIKAKNHKPMICIPEEDRTKNQKRTCRQWLFIHSLCKLDQDCAILN